MELFRGGPVLMEPFLFLQAVGRIFVVNSDHLSGVLVEEPLCFLSLDDLKPFIVCRQDYKNDNLDRLF